MNFGQIRRLTRKLAALECLKICCFHLFSVAIYLILFKLADKEKMHKRLDNRRHNYQPLSIHKIPTLGYKRKMVYSFFLFLFLLT